MGRNMFDVWETDWWRDNYVTGVELLGGYGTI